MQVSRQFSKLTHVSSPNQGSILRGIHLDAALPLRAAWRGPGHPDAAAAVVIGALRPARPAAAPQAPGRPA